MNILVFGAGALGSLYAAKLQQAGQVVTILARGRNGTRKSTNKTYQME